MFPYFYLSKGSKIHGISFTLLSNPNITIKKKKPLISGPLILKLSDLSENKEQNIVFLCKADGKQTSWDSLDEQLLIQCAATTVERDAEVL